MVQTQPAQVNRHHRKTIHHVECHRRTDSRLAQSECQGLVDLGGDARWPRAIVRTLTWGSSFIMATRARRERMPKVTRAANWNTLLTTMVWLNVPIVTAMIIVVAVGSDNISARIVIIDAHRIPKASIRQRVHRIRIPRDFPLVAAMIITRIRLDRTFGVVVI